jgi:hypothetical protein
VRADSTTYPSSLKPRTSAEAVGASSSIKSNFIGPPLMRQADHQPMQRRSHDVSPRRRRLEPVGAG